MKDTDFRLIGPDNTEWIWGDTGIRCPKEGCDFNYHVSVVTTSADIKWALQLHAQGRHKKTG